MINTITTYRKLFASFFAMWMSLIVISGIVFMHKEVTSNGEIITHIHPYDFTKKKEKHKHKSDAEIHYLDVVFQGSFIESSFISFELPVRTEYQIISPANYTQSYQSTYHLSKRSRGPPTLLNI